jgi:hypothetical protein
MARKALYKHATQVDTTAYPDDGSSPVGSNEWNADPDAQGMLGFSPANVTRTISSGVVTPTDSIHIIAAESGTSDDLDKLAIANTNQYDLIYLFADTGDTITLKNTSSPSADGQIKTVSDADETLSTTKPSILIRKGNYWYGYGGGSVGAGSITTAKLADDAVTSAKIGDNAVNGTHIAMTSDAVGDILYYDGTNYTRLAKGSANQVLQMGGSNIPEWGAVAATEIAAGAVGTSELAADAVDGTKIADDAINSEHYTDGSIDTAHIADDQVTLAKMAGLARGKIIYGDASGNPAALTIGTNGQALKSDGTDLVWGSAGGGATIVHTYTNTNNTSYAGTASSFSTVGVGDRDIFIKKIDANNEGVFTKIWKNGSAVEVQIA